MATLNIGKDFSNDPYGRYRTDGDSSGEVFREDCLKPSLQKLGAGEKLVVVLDDDVEGYGSSFLVEGFAGIVKYGYMTSDELLDKIELKFKNPEYEFYKNRILQYIRDAKYNSQEYKSTK